MDSLLDPHKLIPTTELIRLALSEGLYVGSGDPTNYIRYLTKVGLLPPARRLGFNGGNYTVGHYPKSSLDTLRQISGLVKAGWTIQQIVDQGAPTDIPTTELISKAQLQGIYLGSGDPVNYIRYLTKLGILPNAQRQSVNGSGTTVGHYPITTLDTLKDVERRLRAGETIQQIAQAEGAASWFVNDLAKPEAIKPTLISHPVSTPVLTSDKHQITPVETNLVKRGWLPAKPVLVAAAAVLGVGVLVMSIPIYLSGRGAGELSQQVLTTMNLIPATGSTTLDAQTSYKQESDQNFRLKTVEETTKAVALAAQDLSTQNQSVKDIALEARATANAGVTNLDSTTQNQIQNSSFELNNSGQPDAWQYISLSDSNNTFVTQEASRTGQNSVKFTPAGVSAGGIKQSQTLTRSEVDPALSAWVKGVGLSSNGYIRIGLKDATGKFVSKQDYYLSGTFDWQRLTLSASFVGAYPAIEFKGYTKGVAYVDDWQVTEGSVQVRYNQNNNLGQGTISASGRAELAPIIDGRGSLGMPLNRFGALYLTAASIDKSGNMSVSGTITSTAIQPSAAHAFDIGTATTPYRNVYADSIVTGGSGGGSGDLTVSGNLQAVGTSHLQGNVTIDNNLFAPPAGTVGYWSRSGTTLSPSTTGDSISTTGSITGATLTTTGNASIGGTLSTTGVTTLTGQLSANGGIITNNSTINAGTGAISGGAITGTTLTTSSNASVGGNLSLTNGVGSAITPSGPLTVGATGQSLTLQGSGATSLSATAGGFTSTFNFLTPTAARVVSVPNESGTVCLQNSVNCGFAPSTGGTYLARNSHDTSTVSFGGNLYDLANTNTGAGGVLGLTNSGTNSALSVTSSGNPAAGQALVLANNTNGAPSGNLLDLQTSGSSKFSVSATGAVTSASLASAGVVTNTSTGLLATTNGTTGQYLRANSGSTPNFATISSGEINNADFIVKVPTTTAANTIQPTVAATIGLTIKGSSTSNTKVLDIFDSQVTPAEQAYFDSTGALTLNKAITAPTTANTINGLVISGGSLSGVTGYNQGSGSFTITTASTINLGTAAINLNGPTSVTGTNSFTVGTGATSLGGSLAVTGASTLTGQLSANGGIITNNSTINAGTGAISGGAITGTTLTTSSNASVGGNLNLTNVAGAAITPSGLLTIGATGQNLTLQGAAGTKLTATSGLNTTTVSFTNPTANRSVAVPDEGGTICLQASANCGFAPGGVGTYLARNSHDSSTVSFVGNLYDFSNTNIGAAGVLSLTNSGTNSALSITQSGNPAAGQALVLANNTNGAPSGNLLDLQTSGSSKFSVSATGAVTSASSIQATGATLTGLTQGSVIFAGTGGIISQNNSQFFWDNTNNRLGIGTTNPTQLLSVNGNIEIKGNSGNRYVITDETATGTTKLTLQAGAGSTSYGGALNLWGAGNLTKPGWVTVGLPLGGSGSTASRFTVNDGGLADGNDIFTVLRSGNVGINTSAPTEKLEVAGNERIGSAPATATTINQIGGISAVDISVTVLSTTSYPTAGTLLIDSEAMTYTGTTATSFTGLTRGVLGTTAATHANGATVNNYLSTFIASSTTPRVVITGAGNVGIGTTAPAQKLHVSGGNVRVDDGQFYGFYTGSTQESYIQQTTNKFVLSNLQNGGFELDTAGFGAAVRILDSGNVGIGTSSPTSFKLQSAGNIGPDTNNSFDLGSSTLAFRSAYLATSEVFKGTSFNTTLGFIQPTATRSINLPDEGGTVCLQNSVNCGFQAAGNFLKKDAQDTSTVNTGGYLYTFTNNSAGVAGVLSLVGAGTNPTLSVTTSGNPVAGQAVILVNNTNGAPSGKLLDLQTGGVSKFNVDQAGAVNAVNTISNTYTATASDSVFLNVTNSASSGSSTVNAERIALAGTNNGTGTNTINGLFLPNVSAFTNNSFYAINIGTGFNDALRVGGTQIINGSGVLQSAGFSGTYSNAVTLSNGTNSITTNNLTATGGSINGTTIGSTTASTGAFTTLSASGLASLNGGATITCTNCITDANVVDALTINGGTVNNTPVGATTASTGAFTTLSASGLISANGGLTLAANQNLTFTAGTGLYTQTYTNTGGNAAFYNVTNSASAGSTTVNALDIALTGTANGTGTNTNNGLLFPNVTPVTNNVFNALNVGTGYDNIIKSTNATLTGSGNLTLSGTISAATTGTINGVNISSGALSGVTGYTQSSGNFAISGTGTFGTGTGAISLNGATTVTGTNTLTVGTGATSLGGTLSVTGAATFSSTINSDTLTSTSLAFAGANPSITAPAGNNLNLDAGTTGAVNIASTSTGNVNLAGGSAATGCTVARPGNLSCAGTITGGSTGTVGYWSRTGTTLQPSTAGDNVQTTAGGTLTSAGLLTASNGLTLTTGALNLTATSGTEALTLSSSTTAFNVNSGLFDIDTLNSRVGVGTTAPGAKFHVFGVSGNATAEIQGTSFTSWFGFGANEDNYIRAGKSGGAVFIQDNSIGNTIINPGGSNVGIGTTAPQQKLTLGPSSNFATEMTIPTGFSIGPTTGGTLVTGTYFYKVTALDGVGETAGSAEISQAVSNPTSNAVSISWTAVTGAASYRIYRGTTTGGENVYYTSTTTSFIDINGASTAGSPPTVTTSYVNKLAASGASWLLGGNIGIGTSVPALKLEVTGSSTGTVGQKISNANTAGQVFLALGETFGDVTTPFYIQRYGSTSTNALGVDIWNASNGFIRLATNNIERARIDASGNVGIGTNGSAANALLDVRGNIVIPNGLSSAYQGRNAANTANVSLLQIDTGNNTILNSASGALTLIESGGTEAARFSATTAQFFGTLVSINNGTSTLGIGSATVGGSASTKIQIVSNGSTSASAGLDVQSSGSASLLYVRSDGNVGVGTNNPGSFKLQIAGHTGPDANATYDLGSSTLAWRNIYAGNLFLSGTSTSSGGFEVLDAFNNGFGGIGRFENELTFSEQFNNAAWTATNVTVTANNVLAPDDLTTASTLADSLAGGSVKQTGNTASANVSFTGSIWLKVSTGTQNAGLRIDSANTTGTEKTVSVTSTWQRFNVNQTFSGTSTGNATFVIFPGGSAGSGTIQAYGAQLENVSGRLFSTPGAYVRATTSAIATAGGVVSNGGLTAVANSTTDVPFITYGAPSQTGNLGEFRNSAGTAQLYVKSNGDLVVGPTGTGKITVGVVDPYLITNQGNVQSALEFRTTNTGGTDDFVFEPRAVEKMRLTAAGNLGIGTSGPGELLSVFGNAKTIELRNSTTTPRVVRLYADTGNQILAFGSNDVLRIGKSDPTQSLAVGGFTEYMRIDTAGNIGIGTTSPNIGGSDKALTIGSINPYLELNATSGSHAQLRFYNNGVYKGGILKTATDDMLVTSVTGKQIGFSVDGGTSNLVTIAATTGNVGIATTTPQQKLVLATANNFGIEMAAPAIGTVTCSITGGSLSAGTYFFKLTASDNTSASTSTIGSSEGSCTVASGTTGSVVVNYTIPSGGAQGFRIYKGTSAAGEDRYQVSTSQTTFTYTTDTGATLGSVPTTTNAYSVNLANATSKFIGNITSPGTGTGSEKFGLGAVASSINGTAFGNAATAACTSPGNSVNCTAIGVGAQATGLNTSTAIGAGAIANNINTVAVGDSATTGGNSGTVVGSGATLTGGSGSAFGASATAANTAVALGHGASAAGLGSSVLGYAASAGFTGSIALGSSATTTAVNQLVVGSSTQAISSIYFGNGVTNAAPTTYTINGTGGSGTNIGGGSVQIAGGQGTGTGAGGTIIFQTAAAGATGSSLNALAERMRIDQNGNVGIGTTGPTQKLQVSGNILGTGDANALGSRSSVVATTGLNLWFDQPNASTTTALSVQGTNTSTGATTDLIGVQSLSNYGPGGTSGAARSIYDFYAKAPARDNPGNTLTNYYGFYADTVGDINTTNSYGLYLNSFAGTSKYGVYINGETNDYFSGNVGIGTVSPADTLTVKGKTRFISDGSVNPIDYKWSITGSGSDYDTLYLQGQSVTGGALGSPIGNGNSILAIQGKGNNSVGVGYDPSVVGFSAKLAVNGNVGIGTTAPAVKLDVNGDTRLNSGATQNAAAEIGSSTTTSVERINLYSTSVTLTTGASYANQRFNYFDQPTLTNASAVTITNSSSLYIAGAPTATGSTTLTTSNALKINPGALSANVNTGYGLYVDAPTGATNNYAATFASGNVGIGTTTPTQLLHILASSGTPTIRLEQSGAGGRQWDFQANNLGQLLFKDTLSYGTYLQVTGGANASIALIPNGGTGGVGIGTASPASKLDVRGAGFFQDGTNSLQVGTGWGSVATQAYVATGGTGTSLVFGISGSEVARFASNLNFGIGTTTPTQKLNIYNGNVLNDRVTAQFTPETTPGAPTVAVNVTAGVLNGAYTYKITFLTASGETEGGTTSATVSPVNQQVNLSAIPTGTAGVTTARKIYRTAAGGADLTQKFVGTIADNVTTTYTDNLADGSLGALVPRYNTTDSINALANNFVIQHLSGKSVVIGDGVNAATSKLTVASLDPYLITNTGTFQGALEFRTTNTGGTDDFIFEPRGVEKFRIPAVGDISFTGSSLVLPNNQYLKGKDTAAAVHPLIGIDASNNLLVGDAGAGGVPVALRLQTTGTSGIQLYTGSTAAERVRIDSTGNVGIGTTSPGASLEIASQNALLMTGFQPYLTFKDTNASNALARIQNASGSFYFYPNSFIGGNAAVTILSTSGNVGIGTTAPENKLQVVGAIESTGTRITPVGSGVTLSSESTYDALQSWNGRPLVLNGAGNNVGIGTTSPAEKLSLTSGNLLLDANATAATGLIYLKNAANFGTSRDGGLINLVGSLTGRLINRNPTFLDGTSGYSVYDNSGGGRTTIATALVANAPNSSGTVLRVSYNGLGTPGTNPTPGYGGFYVATNLCAGTNEGVNTYCYREGNRIVYKIWANIPSGYNIQFATNATGTGGNLQWQTAQAGTGNWKQYIAIQTIGIGGTFSSTGYFYVDTGANVAFSWDVAEFEQRVLDESPSVTESTSLNIGYLQGQNLNYGQLLTTQGAFLAVSGGNVGVGTAAPGAKLDVTGNAKDILIGDAGCGAGFGGIGFGVLSGCTNYSLLGDSTNTYINRPTGGGIFFRENNNAQVAIAAGGNVGIGTASPGTTLDVLGTATTIRSPSLTNNALYLNSGSGTGSGAVSTIYFQTGGITQGYIQSQQNNKLLELGTNGSTRLVVDTNGNVGIGRTNPGVLLDLTQAANGNQIRFETTGGTGAGRQWTLSAWNTPNSFSIDESGVASRLTILPGGNVGIGTATPNALLHVAGSGTGTTVLSNLVARLSSPTTGKDVSLQFSDTQTNAAYISMLSGDLHLSTSVVSALVVKTSGNIGIGTTSPSALLSLGGTFTSTASLVLGPNDFTALGVSAPHAATTGMGMAAYLQPNILSGVQGSSAGLVVTDTTGAGTVSLQAGILIRSLSKATNNTSLLIGTDIIPAAQYGIYNASTSQNYFAGNIGIGNTSPVVALDISGSLQTLSGGFGPHQNKFTKSEEFDNSVWNKDCGSTVTANTTVAPDGSTTADTFTRGSGACINWTQLYQQLNENPVGNTYTFSIWLRSVSGTQSVTLGVSDVFVGTQTCTAVTATTTWQRFSCTKSGFTGTTAISGGIGGMAAGNQVIVWGGQLEISSTMGVYAYTSDTAIATKIYGLFGNGTSNVGNLFTTPTGVGIGTTAPQDLLHLNSSGNSPQLRIQGAGSTWGVGLGLQGIANTTFAIQDVGQIGTLGSGAIRLAINSSGNVGIGTTAPAQLVEVRKDQDTATYIQITNQNTTASAQSILRLANSATGVNLGYTSTGYTSVVTYDRQAGAYLESAGSGGLSLGAANASGIITFNTGGNSEKVRIDSGGNVGIGTTSPQSSLDIGDATSGRSIVWGGSAGTTWYNTLGSNYSSAALSLIHGLKLSTATADQYLYSTATLDRSGIRVGDASTGDISFFSAASSLQTVGGVFDYVANTKLIIKGTGNVGIGTTGPASKLHVEAGASLGITIRQNNNLNLLLGYANLATTPTLAHNLYSDGSGNAGQALYDGTGSIKINFLASGSSYFNGGNVGIGNTSPLSKLDVLSSGTANIVADNFGVAANFTGPTAIGQGSNISIDSNDAIAIDTGGVLGFGGRYSGTSYANWASIKGLKADGTAGNYGGYLSFFTRTTGFGSAERMRIDTNGNVGIGAASPGPKLYVSGNTNGAGLNFQTVGDIAVGTGTGSSIFFDGNYSYASGNYIQAPSANTQAFFTAGAERARITSTGSVGIGTTAPGDKLEVYNGNVLHNRGNVKLQPELPPGAPTVAINAVAGNLNGAYTYKITFVTASGETEGGTTSASVSPVNQQVNLTAIPTGTSPFVTSRKIYRTKAAGTSYFFVQTIADNTTTTYTDNIADASITVALVNINGTSNVQVTNAENLYLVPGTGKAVVIGDGTGKLTSGTLDPVYDIGGTKYATYAASMLGVKEEVSGSVPLSYDAVKGAYTYTIDLNNQVEGSDLWVFSRIIDPNIDLTTVLLTANGSARTWYVKDSANRRISFYADRPVEISYRLTGPRFDHLDWKTLNPDNKDIAGLKPQPLIVPGQPAPDQVLDLNNGAYTENYQTTDTTIAKGDLVSIATSANPSVAKAVVGYDAKLVGVAITNIAGVVSVAPAGRVGVKISVENGAVSSGDYLTSSATKPGMAMKLTKAGRTLGVALQSASSDGVILATVNPSWFDPNAPVYNPNGTTVATSSNTSGTFTTMTATTATITTANITNLNIGTAKIFADASGNLKVDGNVIITGTTQLADLRVSGVLSLNGVVDAPNGVTVKLGATKVFQITDATGSAKLKISDQGEVAGKSVAVEEVRIATSSATLIPATTTTPDTYDYGSATVGAGTFKAGTTSLLLKTTKVAAGSKIFVSFSGNYAPATRYWTGEVIAATSFTLHLDLAPIADIPFSWWVVN